MSLEKENLLSRAENKFNELTDDSFSFPLLSSASSWSSKTESHPYLGGSHTQMCAFWTFTSNWLISYVAL